MGKHIFAVIGNGFSVDFLSHIKMREEIDLMNLFRLGSHVPWPADRQPGFLSYKHCPNLWTLGARPNMKADEASGLIEDIITCVNVYALGRSSGASAASKKQSTHISAYKELIFYLRYLFVYYNSTLEKIPDDVINWSWCKFLSKYYNDPYVDRITIVNFCYDVWLERVLSHVGIPFNVPLTKDELNNAKITILKPHGSISFIQESSLPREAFSIKHDGDLLGGAGHRFKVRYDDLDVNVSVSPLIPPAGDSGRFKQSWASQIRDLASDAVKSLDGDDELIVCGLSYWHVDRAELDSMLIAGSNSVTVRMINPAPTRAFDAVLTSMFDNYISYSSSKVLEAI
jgi:hypothetical protein